MQHSIKRLQQPILLFMLFGLIAAVILMPIFSNAALPVSKDFPNHLALIYQAKLGLMEGQFPLRVAPLEWNQWRYPVFQFYSPTSYTFAALLYLLLPVSNPFVIYKLVIWLALILGQIYIYRLAYWLTKSNMAATLAGMMYAFSPYYIFILDIIGFFNEAIALGLLPAVIYYTMQRYYHPNDTHLLQSSLGWYLLITIHLITFVLSAFFVGLLFLLVTLKNKQWKHLFAVFLSIVFSCCLAMWHLGPIFSFAQPFVHVELDANMVYKISPSLLQLLSITALHNYSAIIGSKKFFTDIAPTIGLPILITIFFWLFVIFKKNISIKNESKKWIRSLIILMIISFIFIWSPINFWDWLPRAFLLFQFTWRFLGQMMWISALLFAAMLSLVYKNQISMKDSFFITTILILCSSTWLFANPEKTALNIKTFTKHPLLSEQTGAYLINLEKYRQHLNIIESIMLGTLIDNKNLKTYTAYDMDPHLFKQAYSPIITLEGEMPPQTDKPFPILTAVINQTPISSYELKPGKFYWTISLASIPPSLKKQKTLSLAFKTTRPGFSIPIKKVILAGILNPNTTLSLENVQQHCQQHNTALICNLDVASAANLVMLPILYYPNMLTITINDKPTPYQSVFYQDRIIPGIIPEPGIPNRIEITFTGLAWANFVSQISWGLWGIFFIYTLLKRKDRQKPDQTLS